MILRDISNRQDVAAVAEKIVAAVTAPFRLGSEPKTVEIGASIGIAIYPGDAQDHETLIKLADAAMYRAKMQRRSPDEAKRNPGSVLSCALPCFATRVSSY